MTDTGDRLPVPRGDATDQKEGPALMRLIRSGGPGLRKQLGGGLFARVAGPDGARNRALIHGTPGPRWFGPERPVRRVHGDASMFIGGLSALLLQSLHPLAMAAVRSLGAEVG